MMYPRDLRGLMADDNKLTRLLARSLVNKIGWQMDEAENGIQALEKLHTNHYDFVLMDIQMPEMDGVETTMRIRKGLIACSRIPIIACIASPAESNAWKEAGMDDCISKPFTEHELISKVMSLIDKNSATSIKGNNHAVMEKKEIHENTGDSDIINLQKLTSLSGNSKTAVNNIIQVFLKQVPKQMEHLIGLVADKDWDNVKMLSHKMKSSYAIIGANSVRSLLEAIEEDCRQNNVDEARFKHRLDKVIMLNEEVIKSIRTIAA